MWTSLLVLSLVAIVLAPCRALESPSAAPAEHSTIEKSLRIPVTRHVHRAMSGHKIDSSRELDRLRTIYSRLRDLKLSATADFRATVPHDPAVKPAGGNHSGDVFPLADHYSVIYMGDLRVGSPARAFRMVFDTGSSDMWISSVEMPDSARHSYLRYYDRKQSSTMRELSRPWRIQYGQGMCAGFLTEDTVRLGDLIAKSFVFAEATSVSANFIKPQVPIDGILGLGFSGAAQSLSPVLLDSLYEQHQIKNRIFSFYLGGDSNTPAARSGTADTTSPKGAQDSEFILGPPDPAFFKHGLSYSPVIKMYGSTGQDAEHPPTLHPTVALPRMWIVKLDAVMVGGAPVAMCGHHASPQSMLRAGENSPLVASVPCVALLDTGTSLITVPLSRWRQLVSVITAGRTDCAVYESSTVFCPEGLHGLPDLGFQFALEDGVVRSFTLRPEDYMLYGYILAIQPMDLVGAESPTDLIVLGDPFLRRIYTVFDMDSARIGFANVRPQSPDSIPQSVDHPTNDDDELQSAPTNSQRDDAAAAAAAPASSDAAGSLVALWPWLLGLVLVSLALASIVLRCRPSDNSSSSGSGDGSSERSALLPMRNDYGSCDPTPAAETLSH